MSDLAERLGDGAARRGLACAGRSPSSPRSSATPYTVTSDEFEVTPIAALATIDSQVTGTTARVRARYPDPGDALLALPRRVRSGQALIRLSGGGQVTAQPTGDRLAFEATVPSGAVIESVDVEDGCGNG